MAPKKQGNKTAKKVMQSFYKKKYQTQTRKLNERIQLLDKAKVEEKALLKVGKVLLKEKEAILKKSEQNMKKLEQIRKKIARLEQQKAKQLLLVQKPVNKQIEPQNDEEQKFTTGWRDQRDDEDSQESVHSKLRYLRRS